MSLIVQKFGGSSVANAERVMNVAGIVTDTYNKGNDVIVVVSAQGDTTDDLIEKAKEINPHASKRETDMLLSAGEQISISLLAMAIEKLGYPVVSLLGWQAGFQTTSAHTSARIKRVVPDRIKKELDQRRIVIVAGFQGLNRYDDITTLGRGGSDTSAVAIATALHADLCQIYTDVEGVYTADPRKVKKAIKLKEISYDEMLELATLGAQVLNNRSVEMAKKYNIELEVLSSLTKAPGTLVKENAKMEKMLISGVAKDTDVARISVTGIPDRPGLAFKMFAKLSAKDINVDIILQSIGRNDTKDISFTVAKSKGEEAVAILKDYINVIGAKEVLYDDNIAKVSIVGAGMESHAGVASKMFEALYDSHINIQMISTSEIKVSVLIDKNDADTAVAAIHSKFFE
ncbi:aspartate kinase [Anaeromassilibacillus sp. An172]|uniref:aspartate kinase n=1 Tax=Anaeromassilibacillus sp. An172 TaxID=1965570 RepID=UPI000B36DC8A|nr:aspartate kinase [Anaeromassilibacillus sp. An172]MEE0761371.1 aspartate kinase [Acutalibacteraceae bacterium]OUP77412.1 aspartate kinase [Anaeromassilibacillus sp. An172]